MQRRIVTQQFCVPTFDSLYVCRKILGTISCLRCTRHRFANFLLRH
jgi:hypothetical protein